MSPRNRLIEGFGHPITCYFCGKEVVKLEGSEFDSLVIHSLDGDHENWDPSNKEAAHNGCHMTYHNTLRGSGGHVEGSRPPRRPPLTPSIPGVTSYLIHYDLPADSRRKRFYRRIRRYLRERYMDPTEWSTMSVVTTEDRDFAMFVWREARSVGGEAHVYEATCIDPEP